MREWFLKFARLVYFPFYANPERAYRLNPRPHMRRLFLTAPAAERRRQIRRPLRRLGESRTTKPSPVRVLTTDWSDASPCYCPVRSRNANFTYDYIRVTAAKKTSRGRSTSWH